MARNDDREGDVQGHEGGGGEIVDVRCRDIDNRRRRSRRLSAIVVSAIPSPCDAKIDQGSMTTRAKRSLLSGGCLWTILCLDADIDRRDAGTKCDDVDDGSHVSRRVDEYVNAYSNETWDANTAHVVFMS